MSKIVAAARFLREAKDESKKSLASSLSTRQLIRIAKRLEKFGGDAFTEVSRACLSRQVLWFVNICKCNYCSVRGPMTDLGWSIDFLERVTVDIIYSLA